MSIKVLVLGGGYFGFGGGGGSADFIFVGAGIFLNFWRFSRHVFGRRRSHHVMDASC